MRQVIEEYRFFLDERRITLETSLEPVTALGDEQLLRNTTVRLPLAS